MGEDLPEILEIGSINALISNGILHRPSGSRKKPVLLFPVPF